jgi:hypothetical protein
VGEIGHSETPYAEYANDAPVATKGGGVQFKIELQKNIAQGVQYQAQFLGGDEMSDFNGAKPVKTERDNEFKVTLVDGASGESATKKLSLVTSADSLTGAYGVVVFGVDGSGNAIHIPIGAAGVKVEASNLDIRNLVFADDKVDVSGSSVEISNTVTIEATDLDIRALDAAQDSVTVHGTEGALKQDSLGRLEVVIPTVGTKVCDFKTTATVGANSVTTHDYVVTNTKVFSGIKALVGARGAVKVRVGTWDGTTFVPKFAWFQDPKENHDHSVEMLSLLGDGTDAIRIEITNQDGQSSDVYSTLQGVEV